MAIFHFNGRRTDRDETIQPQPAGEYPAPDRNAAIPAGTGAGYSAAVPDSVQPPAAESARSTRDINERVVAQAQMFAQKYPAFRISEETKNPAFRYYIWSLGLSVEEAYLLTHKEEILELLIKETPPAAERRIPENGTGRVYPAVTRPNFSDMSDEELDAIAARVQKGERVTFE